MFEELGLVRWSIRAAIVCYALRVLADAADRGSPKARRAIWTLGLTCYVAHVAAAFHFVHHWSHTQAWRETARQTAAVVGWESGAGLWANYAFTALWLADAAAWWIIGPAYPSRYRPTYITVQIVFAFFVFNGTAVFGPGFWRPAVAVFGLMLAGALANRARRRAAAP